MLTEAEKKWLKEKRVRNECFVRCYTVGNCMLCSGQKTCYLWPNDFKDAAEFEARVAKRVLLLPPCAGLGECVEPNIRLSCEECRLKHARLAVEKEMEAESAGR